MLCLQNRNGGKHRCVEPRSVSSKWCAVMPFLWVCAWLGDEREGGGGASRSEIEIHLESLTVCLSTALPARWLRFEVWDCRGTVHKAAVSQTRVTIPACGVVFCLLQIHIVCNRLGSPLRLNYGEETQWGQDVGGWRLGLGWWSDPRALIFDVGSSAGFPEMKQTRSFMKMMEFTVLNWAKNS